jgi:hypothetical protein
MTPCERAQEIVDGDVHTTACRAARALLAIAPSYDENDTKTGIQDALSDLLHLCDLAGWSFEQMLEAARLNYMEEIHDLGLAADDALRLAIEEN